MSDKDSNVVIGEIVTAMRGPKTEKTRLIIKKEKQNEEFKDVSVE